MDSYNNNTSNDSPATFDTNNESQPANFAPITDPSHIPNEPAQTPTPVQDVLADAMARAGGNSSDNIPNGIDPNQHIENQTLDATNASSDDSSDDDDVDDDDDDDDEPRQVVLGLAAPTQQQREENARRFPRAQARRTVDNDPVFNLTRYRQMVFLAATGGQLGPRSIFFPNEAAPGASHPVAPPPSQPLVPQPFIPQFAEAEASQGVQESVTYILNRREVTVSVDVLEAHLDDLNSRAALLPHELMIRGILEVMLFDLDVIRNSSASNADSSSNNPYRVIIPSEAQARVEFCLERLGILVDPRARGIAEVGDALSQARGDGSNRMEAMQDVIVVDDDDDEAMRLDVDEMTYEELLDLEERIGSVNSGVSDAIIRDNMQHDIYGSSAVASTSRNDPCCICQVEFVNGEDVSTLHCGHTYHFDCIKRWLEIKNNCPICKRTALPLK